MYLCGFIQRLQASSPAIIVYLYWQGRQHLQTNASQFERSRELNNLIQPLQASSPAIINYY